MLRGLVFMEDKHYEELAKIRLERAEELILEAEILLDREMFKSANNRAYICCYISFEKMNGIYWVKYINETGVFQR